MIFMMSGMFYLYAIVVDHKKGMESVKYSHHVVWGNWWRTATIVFVMSVIAMLFYMVVGFAAGMAGLATTEATGAAITLFDVILPIVTGPFVMPFMVAAMSVIYHDLKLRKDGADLSARVQTSGTGATRQNVAHS